MKFQRKEDLKLTKETKILKMPEWQFGNAEFSPYDVRILTVYNSLKHGETLEKALSDNGITEAEYRDNINRVLSL